MDGMRQLAACISSWLPLMGCVPVPMQRTVWGDRQRESIQKSVIMGSMEPEPDLAYPEG